MPQVGQVSVSSTSKSSCPARPRAQSAATSPSSSNIGTRGGRSCSVPRSGLSHVGTHSTRNQQLVQHLFELPNVPGNHCPEADYTQYAPRSFFHSSQMLGLDVSDYLPCPARLKHRSVAPHRIATERRSGTTAAHATRPQRARTG